MKDKALYYIKKLWRRVEDINTSMLPVFLLLFALLFSASVLTLTANTSIFGDPETEGVQSADDIGDPTTTAGGRIHWYGSGTTTVSYLFTTDTGGTALFLCFQPKEVITETNNGLNVGSVIDARKYYLSGYTVTQGFLDNNYKSDPWSWNNLGKIYMEYGTYGLTGADRTKTNMLISDIIATDFASDAVTADDSHLLNALAFRSNAITSEMLSRGIVYIPPSMIPDVNQTQAQLNKYNKWFENFGIKNKVAIKAGLGNTSAGLSAVFPLFYLNNNNTYSFTTLCQNGGQFQSYVVGVKRDPIDIASRIDGTTLNGIAGIERDENKLRDYYLDYFYNKDLNAAYAVLDAVFSHVPNEISSYYTDTYGNIQYKNLKGINFEKFYENWMNAEGKLSSYDENIRYGIRQVQLHCALGAIIMSQLKLPSIDVMSNIEIHCLNTYGVRGMLTDEDINLIANSANNPLLDSTYSAISPTIMNCPGMMFLASTETVYAHIYQYDSKLIHSASKAYNFSRLTLHFANNNLADTNKLVVSKNSTVYNLLKWLGEVPYTYTISGSKWTITAGPDKDRSLKFGDEANCLMLCDTWRQGYMSTLISRQTQTLNNVYNPAGIASFINKGLTSGPNFGITFNGFISKNSTYYRLNKALLDIYLSTNNVKDYAFENALAKIVPSGYYLVPLTAPSGYAIYYAKFSPKELIPFGLPNGINGSQTTYYGSLIITQGLRDSNTKLDSDSGSASQLINAPSNPNIYITGFNTYIPDKDIKVLNDYNQARCDAAQSKYRVLTEQHFYFYNHTFYEMPTEGAIDMVMGFVPNVTSAGGDKSDNSVVHSIAMSDIDNYKLAIGINFSDEIIEAIKNNVDIANGKYVRLTIKLTGNDFGAATGSRLTYFDTLKKGWQMSHFDFSANGINGKTMFMLSSFGGPWTRKASQTNGILNAAHSSYTSESWPLTSSTRRLLSDGMISNSASEISYTISDFDLAAIMKNAATAKVGSDTNYMLLVKKWDASGLFGSGGSNLGSADSNTTLGVDLVYTIGAEVIVEVVQPGVDNTKRFTAKLQLDENNPSNYQLFDATGLGYMNQTYSRVTNSKPSFIYGNVRKGEAGTAASNLLSYRSSVSGANPDNLYGPSSDNHMYFSVSNKTSSDWMFTGEITLEWDPGDPGSKEPYKSITRDLGINTEVPIDADGVVSQLKINYSSETFTMSEFLDEMDKHGVKYFGFTITENGNNEAQFVPKDYNKTADIDAITVDELKLTNLEKLAPGQSLYNTFSTWNQGTIFYSIDQLRELVGEADSTEVSFNIGGSGIKDMFRNDVFRELLVRAMSEGKITTPNKCNVTRLEYDFSLSVYALGAAPITSSISYLDGKYIPSSARSSDETRKAVLTYHRLSKGILESWFAGSSSQGVNKYVTFNVTKGLKAMYRQGTSQTLLNYYDSIEYANRQAGRIDGIVTPAELSSSVITDWIKKHYSTPTSSGDNQWIYAWSFNTNKKGTAHSIVTLPNCHFLETGLKFMEPASAGATGILTTPIGDNLGRNMSSAWLAIGSKEKRLQPPATLVVRTSSPVSYAQVKNGTWQIGTGTVTQDWNVLAGIPSTEKFYITSGGSEYIVELQATEIQAESATRMYESYFAGNSCKFKTGDISLAGTGITTHTKNAISHELNNESVVGTLTDKFNLPVPEGASITNNSVKEHAGSTINATWTGTITNTTTDPGIDNWKDPEDKESSTSTGIYTGKPGEMKKTGQENSSGSYSWDVTAYNAALEQAKAWASQMEAYSKAEGNIITMADSDHIVRSWHCGDAKITITLSNLNDADLTNEYHTIAHRSSLTNSYQGSGIQSATTTNYATLKLTANDARLSSGYFEVYGHAQEWIVSACHSDYNGKNVTGRFNEDKTTSWGGEKALADFNASRTQQSHEYISNYTWTGNETTCSASPVKSTIYGYPNWCGAAWWSGSDATYSFCGKNYHVHSNACCPKTAHTHGSGCTCPITTTGHVHSASCCILTEHTHDGNGCGCTAEVHKHSSSCLHVTARTVSATGHVCYANHTVQNWKKTTTAKAGTVNYKIEVNFEAPYTYSDGKSTGESDNVTGQKITCPKDTVPEHSLCGPCCQHELPEISDHWYQVATYRTVSITDVSVLKISRSSVAGLNQITLDKKNENGGKYMVGNINSGDLAIFYNIAYENQTYANSVRAQGGYGQYRIIGGVAGASEAGRIRYSVQAQQHDSVFWNEYNQNKVAKRTSECDGQAATKTYNPAANGGQGHANKWSLGILYNRRSLTEGRATHVVDWLHTITNTSLVKRTYTTNSLDVRDIETLEFKRFDMRRDTEVVTNVLTDTLILQGSTGGDKRIMYNSVSNAGSGSAKGGDNKTTEEDSGIKDGLSIDIKKAFNWAGYTGPRRTKGDPVNSYVYRGKGTDKVVLYDILIDISTPRDGLLGGYLGNGNGTLTNQSVTGSNKVSTLLDSNGTAYDATCNHPDEYASVPGPKNYQTLNIVTDGLNAINFRASSALFQKRTYPSDSLRIGQLDIQIDPTTQNGFYDATKATQTWFSILRYTEPDIVPEKKADWTLKELAYNPTETVDFVQGVPVFTQEAYYYGETTDGLLPSANKVNGIVIHTPISSTHSYVTISEDAVYDQRIGIADDKTVTYTSTATCPGSAITCEYSYFDCKYGQDLVVYNTSFDMEYVTTDVHGTSTKHQGIMVDSQGYVISVTDKVNSVTSSIKSGTTGWTNNATYGPGLTQVNSDYAIPLGILGVNYITGTELKLDVRGQFADGTPIYRCGNIVATVYANKITITNGRATMLYPFNNGSAVHDYSLVISYNSLRDFKVTVDGTAITGSLTADSPEYSWQFEKEDWNTALYVGYRGTLYDVKLTHLAGTPEHVEGCYHTYQAHEETLQYLCDEVTRFSGEAVPQAFKAPMDGTYLLELYNSSTGQYNSKYVELKEGQTIYAYLGTKGYWSYNGTDHASTEAFDETIRIPGQIQVAPLSSADIIFEKRYDYGMYTVVPAQNITLEPGIYRLEAIGMNNTGYSGWYTVKNNSVTVTVQHNPSNNNELQIKNDSTVILSSTGTYDASSVQYLTKKTSPVRPGIAVYKYADLSGISDATNVTFSVTSDTLKAGMVNTSTDSDNITAVTLNPGSYNFSLSGAAGGGSTASDAGSRGGAGGIVQTYLNLDTRTTFHLFVGGKGQTTPGTALGGWNGGGSATLSASNAIGAGGGATDIRVGVKDYTGASCYDSRISYVSGSSYVVSNYSAAHDCLPAGPVGKYIQVDVYGSGLNTLTGLSHCSSQGQIYRDIYHTADHVTYIVTKADAYINSSISMGLVFNANGAVVDRIVMSALDSRVLVAGGGGGSDDTGTGSSHVCGGTITTRTVNTRCGKPLGSESFAYKASTGDEIWQASCSAGHNNRYTKGYKPSYCLHDIPTTQYYCPLCNKIYTGAGTCTAIIGNVDTVSGSQHTASSIRVTAASSNDNDESGGAGGGYIQICTPDYTLGSWNVQSGASAVLNTTTNKNYWQLPTGGGVHIYTDNDGLLPSYQNVSITVTLEGTNTDKLVFRPSYHNGSGWIDGGYTATAVSVSSTKSIYKITATTNYPKIAFCIYNEGSATAILNSVTVSDMTGRPPVTTGYTASFGYGTQTGCNTIGDRTSGGFGFGGFYVDSSDYGGGGGGYYGGSSGGNGFKGGAGGSSYVSGDPACDTTYLAYQKSNGTTGDTLNFYNTTATAGGASNTGYGGLIVINGFEDTIGSASISAVTVDTLVEKQQQYTTWVWNADQGKIILDNTSTQVIDFPYTGQVQRVTLNPGIYKLEAWGASGGGDASMAGQGGYTTGTITLNKTTTLYVYVGEAGTRSHQGNGAAATFNGGGDGGSGMSEKGGHLGGSGGGATDFRLISGQWNNTDSLKSRILIAGGGGGSGCASSHNPGHGGGLTGVTTINTGYYYHAMATGGTQTQAGYGNGQVSTDGGATYWGCPRTAGKFGAGASAAQCGAGGGGGYYGGGSNYTAGGAGGSSYVSGYTGCDTTFRDSQKINGAYPVFTNVDLQQGGNTGNGRARITKLAVVSGTLPEGVSIYNDILTYAPTTPADQSAPANSPYYWFDSSVKYNVAQVRLAAHTHTDKCKTEYTEHNAHTHTVSCIDTVSAMYKYMLYCAASGNTTKLDELCFKYLGNTWSVVLKSSNISTAYSNLARLNIDISKMPNMVEGVDNLILSCLNHLDTHICTVDCLTGKSELICNNIHHSGQHYTDTNNPICYSPCNDNENHGKTHQQIFDTNYEVKSAVNLESYFTVYWNNLGDFREDETLKCSTNPTQIRGQGYTQNMDTTRWIKRKCIQFKDIDVLYFNELTKSWELYKAGETIYLPVVTDGVYGNGDDDVTRDWRNANQNAVTSYHFYNLLSNGEYAQTSYTCWTEALNSVSSAGQGNKPYDKNKGMVIDENPKETNRDRGNKITNFTSLHSTTLTRTFDVMGNIGNLLITYTTDYRWSNFFKKADTSAWQVENILYNTYDDQQRYYLNIGKNTDNRDIRNHVVTEDSLYFDTWNTEPWKQTKPVNDILCKELLGRQPEVWSKLNEDLKCGYDIYCEVTTTGDYNHIDVDYQYYVLDTLTGEISCVDLWSNVSGNKQCYYLSGETEETISNILNKGSLQGFQGITSTNNIALYNLYNDFNTQLKQRMITHDQLALTEALNQKYWGITGLALERTCIGNAYGVDVAMHNMVYVGSSYDNMSLADGKTLITTGRHEFTSGITETNIGSRVNSQRFQLQARRWLFTAGIAENTTAVIYNGTKHVDLTTSSQSNKILKDGDRYRLLVGVDIKAHGGVWQLAYDAFDSTQNVLGVNLPSDRNYINQYNANHKPKAYFDIIAVYSLDSKEDDKDVIQSH